MSERNTDIKRAASAAVRDHLDDIGEHLVKGLEPKLREVSGDVSEIRERVEYLESMSHRTGHSVAADGTVLSREQKDHVQKFCAWLRDPKGLEATQELGNVQAHLQRKASMVVTGTPAHGGWAVPEILLREIETLEKKFSPVRDLVNVVRVGSGDMRALVNVRGATAGWSSETGARTATDTSELREIAPTGGELFALPKASEWALDDMYFNVQQWLVNEVAEAFAILEGEAVIRGDGTQNRPTGMPCSTIASPSGNSSANLVFTGSM